MTKTWLNQALLGGAMAVLALTLYPILGLVPLFLAAWILWFPFRGDEGGRGLLAVLLLFLTLWILHQVRWIVYPLLAGMLLAYLLDPLVDRLERIKLPRTVGAVLALIPLALLGLATLIVLVPTLIGQFQEIVDKVPDTYRKLYDLARPLLSRLDVTVTEAGENPPWLEQLLAHLESILRAAVTGVGEVGRGLTLVMQWVGVFLLTPVFAYYLLVDWDRLRDSALALVPSRWRATAERVNDDVQDVLPKYIRGQVIVALIQTALFIGGFILAGLPEALALGFLAGLFSLVPVLGFWATVLVVGLSAVTSGDPAGVSLGVGIVLLVVNILEGHLLVPRIQGTGLGLHPFAVLLTVLGFGLLFGFFGVLLAVPTLGVVTASLPRLRAAYLDSRFYHAATRTDSNPEPSR